MNTKNLLLLIALVSTIATIYAAEIKQMDVDAIVKILTKNKATQIIEGGRQTSMIEARNYTQLHQLIFDPSISPQYYAAQATWLVKNGCPLDTQLNFTKPTAWLRKFKQGQAFYDALKPYACIPAESFTFADLVQEIMDIDNKPWKEKLLNRYPNIITDKPTLIAICKGVIEGKKGYENPVKPAVDSSLSMLSFDLTNIIIEYTDDELDEIAKLKALLEKHQ